MNKPVKALCIAGTILGTAYTAFFFGKKTEQKKIVQLTKEKEKFYQMFRLMDDWMNKKIKGNKVEEYLLKKNYRNIAIYGMSYIGQTLINELEDSEICIKYGIDQNSEIYWDLFPIVAPQEMTDDIDAVIVTALSFYDGVKNTLQGKINCPIISLEEIVDAL